MLLLQLVVMVIRGFLAGKAKSLSEGNGYHFRVGINDLDENFHLNNAHYVRYMQLARWAYMIQTGFFKMAIKNKWFGPIVGVKVVFFRPIGFLQKFTVTVNAAYADDEWIFMEQKVMRADQVHAIGYFKTKIIANRQTFPPGEVANMLGYSPIPQGVPEDLQAWHSNDKQLFKQMKKQ